MKKGRDLHLLGFCLGKFFVTSVGKLQLKTITSHIMWEWTSKYCDAEYMLKTDYTQAESANINKNTFIVCICILWEKCLNFINLFVKTKTIS